LNFFFAGDFFWSMNWLVFLLRLVQVVSPIAFVRNWVRLRTAPLRALSPVGLFVAIV
jgi:hypothetical protein